MALQCKNVIWFILGRTYFQLCSPIQQDSLVVFDPFNSANNLATNVYRYGEIRACFARVLSKILFERMSLQDILESESRDHGKIIIQ